MANPNNSNGKVAPKSVLSELTDELQQRGGLLVVDEAFIGGALLYRFVRSRALQAIFRALGEAGILVRRFNFNHEVLRFGLPGSQTDTYRLKQALMQLRGTKVSQA